MKRSGCLTGVMPLVLTVLLALLGYGNYVAVKTWQQGTLLDRSGVTTQAAVVSTRTGRGSRGLVKTHFVEYRLPGAVDPAGQVRTAEVDPSTLQRARRSGVLEVQYVPAKPAVQRIAGTAPERSLALWMGLLDVLVLGLFVAVRLERVRNLPGIQSGYGQDSRDVSE